MTGTEMTKIHDMAVNGRVWQCEYESCRAVYAEYVNGCPKCYMGEVGTSSSVILVDVCEAITKLERARRT